MKTDRMIRLGMVALAHALLPQTGEAQTQESIIQEAAESAENLASAELYLHHFFQRNMDELREFWTDHTVDKDAVYGMVTVGVDSRAVTIPAAWDGVSIESTEVVTRWGSGNGIVTYVGRARGSITGTNTIRFEVPYVMILTFDEGRVVEHQNYFHYTCLNRQAWIQVGATLPYDLLPECIG